MNKYASKLGKLAKGKPKQLTQEQIRAASERLKAGRDRYNEERKRLKAQLSMGISSTELP